MKGSYVVHESTQSFSTSVKLRAIGHTDSSMSGTPSVPRRLV